MILDVFHWRWPSRPAVKYWGWALGILAVSRFVVTAHHHHADISDDAYISFRFARNLAEGHGLAWNVGGPPTEGYSNFLWVLIVAVCEWAGWNPEIVSPPIMAAMVAATAVVLLRMLARHFPGSSPWGVLLIAIFVASRYTAIHSISGLETPLAVLLVALSMSAALDLLDRPSDRGALRVAVVFMLALLTRPDLVLIVGGLSVALLSGWKRLGIRSLAICFGTLAMLTTPYLIWKAWYFGYLLPNPFYVKSAPANIWALAGLREVLRFFDHVRIETHPMWIPIAILLLLRPSTIVRMWRQARVSAGDRSLRPTLLAVILPPVFGWVYYATIIHDVGFASRFSFPTYPFVLLWAAALAALWSRSHDWPQVPVRVVLIIAVILGISFREGWSWTVRPAFFPADLHEPIAAALTASQLGPRVSLHFVAAGLIPYKSRVNHIDPIGLTENALSGREPISRDRYEEILWSHRPDVYLSAEPPASPGATSADTDPIMSLAYSEHLVNGNVRLYGIAWRHPRFGPLDPSENRAFIYRRMQRLRDEYVWLGEHYSESLWRILHWRMFVYVRADSGFRRELTDALRTIVEIPASAVDLTQAAPRNPAALP